MQDKGAPATQNSMNQSSEGALASRLATLNRLVQREALTKGEHEALRVPFLSEDRDLTPLLMEAADLRDAGSLSPAEFDALKGKLVARLG